MNGRTGSSTAATASTAASAAAADVGPAATTGRKRPTLGKQPLKWFSFDVDNASSLSGGGSSGDDGGPLQTSPASLLGGRGVTGSQRRGSFLYRPDDDLSFQTTNARNPSSDALNRLADGFVEEHIVTPFAQILRRLQAARNKFVQHARLNDDMSINPRRGSAQLNVEFIPSSSINQVNQLPKSKEERETLMTSREILDDIDWCLDRLESVQSHRTIADLASSKFKRILNKELSHLAESSKAGSQVSEYISNTFLDNEAEETECLAPLPSERNGLGFGGSGGGRGLGSGAGTKTNRRPPPMSQISVLRTLGQMDNSFPHSEALPKYGVDVSRVDQLESYMMNIDAWGVNIFRINEITSDHSLTVITYSVMRERDLLTKLCIDERQFVTYMLSVEAHYHSAADVPYHNQVHGADVVQSVHSLLSLNALQDVFTDLEQAAVLIAGAIHDVDHPGVTNQFLVNTNSELALMYNDESVLENHHLAVAFKLMQQAGCDIFARVPTKTRHKLRKNIIDLVLATDMSKHMSLLASLKTMVEARNVSGSIAPVLDGHNNKLQVMQNMLHCADLSNPTKPLDIYRQWTDKIMEEFFKQGDKERQLGLDLSPMCDRHTATVEKSQVGFIEYIVQPLWETWQELVHPDCADILDTLEDNKLWYQHRICTVSSPPVISPDNDTSRTSESSLSH